MAFKFKRKESTTEALRRLCADRVGEALNHLKECYTLDAVHGVRKEIKRLRALLRSVRSGMKRSDFRGVTQDLKEAARQFGPARDAHVTSQALGMLVEHYRGQLGPRPFAGFRPLLRKTCEQEEKRLREQRSPEHVGRLLSTMRKNIEGITLRKDGWNVIGAGIKRSYGNGRRAWKLALAETVPENLHEWRKQAKELGYQLRLLEPIWPEQLHAAIHELKALGAYLGDDHDLFMLKQTVVDKFAADVDPGEIEVLCGLVEQRQSELRRAATALGARFYAEKPSVFCRRLGNYWNIWRCRASKAGGRKRKVGRLAR